MAQPPPPAYPAQPGQPTTVIYQPAPIIHTVVYRESPVQTKCPSCQADIVTSTSYETGTFTWVICLVLAFFGLWLGCCLIPFCVNGCKDVVHTCPNCRTQVGRFNRM